MSYLSTTNFLDDKSFADKWLYTMRTGELDLSWMNARTEKINPSPQNARRGLTYRDLDLGTYGFSDVPEKVRENRSYAPRGAEIPPGLPDAQPEVSRKSELWAFNTEGYYEEAVTRQWNATTDIPWERLEGAELPEAIGKALSQLMTFLTEVEMIATDTPAKWLPRLNPEFIEVQRIHRVAGHGRGAPCRGLPQARADHRMGPDEGQSDERDGAQASARRRLVQRDVGGAASGGRGQRAHDVPLQRVPLADRR